MFASSAQKIQEKRKEREEKVKRSQEALAKIPLEESTKNSLLSASVEEIVQKIKSGSCKVEEAVASFASRALEAHQDTNCLTEIFVKEALEEGKRLQASGDRNLPLFGLPVSFKDTFAITGYDWCYGYSSHINDPAQEDASLVRVMRELGAIPFVKTNIPQTLLAFDGDNPVFGATNNPWNPNLIPGGSSSGEGALLALGGSAFGFGSDIGGSLRIPAGFSGIYSLKPSNGRFPIFGHRAQTHGQTNICPVTGPMARNVKDLQFVSRLILQKPLHTYDHESIPIPWREVELPKRMRFGYYVDDGVIKSTPAVARSVHETVAALRAQGHECFEFKLGNLGMRGLEIFFNILGADGGRHLLKPLRPDPMTPAVAALSKLVSIPAFLRRILGFVAERYSQTAFAAILRAGKKSANELWDWGDKLSEFQHDFWNEWNKQKDSNGNPMDGIICPVMSLPPPVHGSTEKLSAAAVATFLYNILDYSVGVVPASAVDASVDKLDLHPEWFNGNRTKSMLESITYGYYDPEMQDGAPLGVQVVGRRYEEEKVLKMMKVVDDALEQSGRKKPRRPSNFK